MPDLWVHRPIRQTLQPETKTCFLLPTESIQKQTQGETRNLRREIKAILKKVY